MNDAPPDGHGYAHIGAALATSAGSAVFGWNQNRGEIVGGPIHWAKAAWLNITVINFIVLPLLWWRSSNASPPIRRVMRTLGLQFVGRGAAELPMIYKFHNWKCGYGISHDVLVFALMGEQLLRYRDQIDPRRDRIGLAQCALAMSMLLIEGTFAKLFRSVQDPATGIYFADDSPKFRRIVRITKAVVAVVYPATVLLLWMSRRHFAKSEGALARR